LHFHKTMKVGVAIQWWSKLWNNNHYCFCGLCVLIQCLIIDFS